MVNAYLGKKGNINNTDYMFDELSQKKRGWGSACFVAKKDQYCVVKEEHLKAVQEFVSERNKSMRGMCTINSIIAHTLAT